ncbi:putative disease resistance protein RGA4 [Telopea speciosissima]|uniref:putative disease resistance protein RGA4 n=1 Tax=Telopea speciosissima TaxID=54955 RepID=UPI001CC594CA|nr:putative disease resistance protein RGA4 [Telopea speciosissima]
MAQAILSDLATKILEGLDSLLIQEIGLESGELKQELSKLKNCLSTTNAILLDAEKKGAMNDVVKDWLRKVMDVAYDVEDVLDEFATEALRKKVMPPNNNNNNNNVVVAKQVRRNFSRSNPAKFSLKMAHKIKDIMERLDCILKDAELAKFQFKTQTVDMNINGDDRSTPDDPIVIESEVLGREKDKEILIELLTSGGSNSNEENINLMVIPKIGIGGLGKTTLARYVYNDERVIKKHFELRMWVCVSFDFDVLQLAKKILESLTNDNYDGLWEDQAESELREKLSGKRYLLVLDDVWNDNPSKWENSRKLLISVRASSGSMILVTTRSEMVAKTMQPIKSLSYHLEGLNENDCESLFNERAFGKGNNEVANHHPELVGIGKDIVKKCGRHLEVCCSLKETKGIGWIF